MQVVHGQSWRRLKSISTGCHDSYRKKTLGENLEELKNNGFYGKCDKWLQEFNKRCNVNVTKEDIIRPYDKKQSEQMDQQGEPDILQHRKIHGPGGNDIQCPDPAGKMGHYGGGVIAYRFKMGLCRRSI